MISFGNKKYYYYFCLVKMYLPRVMARKKKNKVNKVEETGKTDSKQPVIDAVTQRHNNKYIAVLYILTSAVALSFVWGVIRWGWLSLDILQNAKSFVRHFVAAINDKIENYVFAGIIVFSFQSKETEKETENGVMALLPAF